MKKLLLFMILTVCLLSGCRQSGETTITDECGNIKTAIGDLSEVKKHIRLCGEGKGPSVIYYIEYNGEFAGAVLDYFITTHAEDLEFISFTGNGTGNVPTYEQGRDKGYFVAFRNLKYIP
ncbi:MAG: hypothetical protein LBD11_04270 [Candidatus Peribacteria bacterium]|jgi:hypothetical protein|nr:hypothetical protein [Candidatus Peribacteria bacterium]